MVFLAQMLPFSIGSIIPIVISILVGTITTWISAQIVSSRPSIQSAFLFSLISYVVMMFSGYIPTLSIPFISVLLLIQVLIKSVLAMKLFGADFKRGLSIVAVQMLLGMIITIYF
jgi:hypothetical protein